MRKFSASQAERFMACHASANLEKAIPGFVMPEDDEDREIQLPDNLEYIFDMIEKISEDTSSTKAANRGTMLHACMATLMAEYGTAKKMLGLARLFVELSEVMKGRRFKVLIEETVDLHWLQMPTKTTADLVLYSDAELHIWDWKFGTMPVDPDAVQLRIYALAFLHLAPKAKGAWVHVLQPGNYAEQYFTIEELMDVKADMVYHENEVIKGDVTFRTGSHCDFCPASPFTRGTKGNLPCPAFVREIVEKQENSRPVDESALDEL